MLQCGKNLVYYDAFAVHNHNYNHELANISTFLPALSDHLKQFACHSSFSTFHRSSGYKKMQWWPMASRNRN